MEQKRDRAACRLCAPLWESSHVFVTLRLNCWSSVCVQHDMQKLYHLSAHMLLIADVDDSANRSSRLCTCASTNWLHLFHYLAVNEKDKLDNKVPRGGLLWRQGIMGISYQSLVCSNVQKRNWFLLSAHRGLHLDLCNMVFINKQEAHLWLC